MRVRMRVNFGRRIEGGQVPFQSENTSSPSPPPPPSPEQSARDQSDSLNAAIATALGIRKAFCCPKCDGTSGGAVDGTDPEGMWECHSDGCRSTKRRLGWTIWTGPWSDVRAPAFDVDWAAFGELVEALPRNGFRVRTTSESPHRHGAYVCDWAGGVVAQAWCESPPLALRDAAARALGLAAGGEGTR